MAYYKTCPHCGANLDPGEICDCRESLMERAYGLLVKLSDEQLDYVIELRKKEEAALSAANTKSGKVEQGLAANVSTSIITETEV